MRCVAGGEWHESGIICKKFLAKIPVADGQ